MTESLWNPSEARRMLLKNCSLLRLTIEIREKSLNPALTYYERGREEGVGTREQRRAWHVEKILLRAPILLRARLS